ncbi:c-type cytochrome [Luteimonas sp. MJ246]|uniref:c-type cytochrome n=1 Tax=Luteimonas sp. MJ174 TaxID=3129237 RepID=UPI0031BA69EC
MRNYDLDFLKRFSLVIGFLTVVTLGLIVLSYFVHKSLPTEVDPSTARHTANRLAPVGAVYAGDTGAAAQAAAAVAAAAAATADVAYGGTLDGSVIYGNLCAGCHTAGVAGAPKLETGDWTARIAQGTETMHRHAIDGFTGATGMMPAKGGNPALTDEQVIATVDWMLESLK